MLSVFAAFEEEMVNVTSSLLRFVGKFFAVFAIIALIGILTPWMAKKVDALREKHRGRPAPEDPRMKAVKGIYDAQEPDEASEPSADQDADAPADEIT
ncbi:MAG: hypothetical protein J6Z45_03855 [Oscillospiraceae bacterium]|nr:hypothetical protein [Oscillospiraceae bacterium]